jgi:hypothetical protein
VVVLSGLPLICIGVDDIRVSVVPRYPVEIAFGL